jgi:hypothetical protein
MRFSIIRCSGYHIDNIDLCLSAPPPPPPITVFASPYQSLIQALILLSWIRIRIGIGNADTDLETEAGIQVYKQSDR